MKAAIATPGIIDYVCHHMRDESAGEAFASLPLTRAQLGNHLKAADQLKIYALSPDHGAAAALVGIGEFVPGRAGIMFLATQRFPLIRMNAHRWWQSEFVPSEMMRYRRVEFTGSLPDTPSGAWLRWVGFTCEGIARAYGRRGEDLAHWAWINPCWRTVDTDAAPLACRRSEGVHV